MMNLHFSEEVATALANNQPVVALESTVITHGLPYPQNRDTALSMEQAVRDGGAVPATIAVLEGRITVGISPSDIERLASAPAGSVRKCSRRDLPIAVGLGEDAATTVAGTMIVANMAGIRVFATGGIGGVHRGHPFDVSADLIELGRTPVAVVCAGAKSILDLPLTLETLETQGVPILGYQTDTLPAFFTRSSGLPIDARVESAEQVAHIIHAARELEAKHGILITVPCPEDIAVPEEVAEKAIQQATEEADAQGIHGKEITPFVLGRVVELTEGRSMAANRALLRNNGLIAAQIAGELVKIQAVPTV
ncbi:pseudouridine-5'-phosphate glycosidase [Phototrophicus methaneseepsis]|uniref:Pseudouridine-5'-phosphate glycosidase n=1 Tax=Phototrophicus methaneseepsis TaxID=2710758 RepID=A0A7S8E5C7_9CHLR|nr:pseudouridine-5'-phosphate glycosidase [Phototrophicus methaneseepsis]QPC80688.1 pseudouridine-5'-phosphate glycosidase [Phototrophicus methaneseepsis]